MHIQEGTIKAPEVKKSILPWYHLSSGQSHTIKQKDITFSRFAPDEKKGTRPTVVFALGFGGSRETSKYVDPIVKTIVDVGCNVYVADYSHAPCKDGYVNTKRLNSQNALSDLDRMVEYALENENIEEDRLALAGVSMGADCILRHKKTKPACRIAAAPVPDFIKPFRKKVTPLKKTVWYIMHHMNGYCQKELLGDTLQDISYPLYEQRLNIDMKKEVKDLTGQIKIITGNKDQFSTPEDVKELAKYMTNAEVKIEPIPDADHGFFQCDEKGNKTNLLPQVLPHIQKTLIDVFALNQQEVVAPVEERAAKSRGIFQRLMDIFPHRAPRPQTGTQPAMG